MFSALNKSFTNTAKSLQGLTKAAFASRNGPYNPYKYKEYIMPRNMPKYYHFK